VAGVDPGFFNGEQRGWYLGVAESTGGGGHAPKIGT